MTINTTITDTRSNVPERRRTPRPKLPGWVWFIALWCFGVSSAVSLGYVFKLLMNATLFAVT